MRVAKIERNPMALKSWRVRSKRNLGPWSLMNWTSLNVRGILGFRVRVHVERRALDIDRRICGRKQGFGSVEGKKKLGGEMEKWRIVLVVENWRWGRKRVREGSLFVWRRGELVRTQVLPRLNHALPKVRWRYHLNINPLISVGLLGRTVPNADRTTSIFNCQWSSRRFFFWAIFYYRNVETVFQLAYWLTPRVWMLLVFNITLL